MSLLEASQFEPAHTWTPEKLVSCVIPPKWSNSWAVIANTRSSIEAFLSADWNIPFGFNELIQCIGNTVVLKGNEEDVLRLMACLFMRLDIELMRKTSRTVTRDDYYQRYREELRLMDITIPPITPPTKTTERTKAKWKWFRFLQRAA